MPVTVRQLRALVALAETGSFTRAADALHVTQSAVSGLIKELESQLGVRLVDRSTRRCTLSPVGAEFHAAAARILRDLDKAVAGVDDLRQLRRGVVRLAAPQLMSSALMPSVVASFRSEYPDVDVVLRDCPVEEVPGHVRQGDVEIGIGPYRAGLAGLAADQLFEFPFVAALPPDHALCARDCVGWADLVHHSLVVLKGPFAEQLKRDLGANRTGLTIRPQREVLFMSTALGLVNAGLGITICLPYAQPLVDLYGLSLRRLQDPVLTREFFVYRREGTSLSPASEAFVGYLRQHVMRRRWTRNADPA